MSKKLIDKYIDYLQGEREAKSTIESYTKTVKQFLRVTGKTNPEDINEEDMQKYKTWCNTVGNKGKPYERNSLIPMYSGLKMFITEILKKPDSLKKRLKVPSMEVKPKEFLTEDEVKRLFSASKDNIRDSAIIKVLYFTTIRRSELEGLNLDDINYENETLRTLNSKGGHHDVRNIHHIALKSIKEYRKTRYVHPNPKRRKGESKEDYEKRVIDMQKALFLNRAGTHRLGKQDISYLLKRYGVIAGIKKRLYPHLLRGSSATHMSNGGMSLVQIQAQTKHRSIDTLNKHYINPSKEKVKKIYTEVFNQYEHDEKPTHMPQLELKKPETKPCISIEDKDKYITELERELQRLKDYNIGYQ